MRALLLQDDRVRDDHAFRPSFIRTGELTVDLDKKTVEVAGARVHLTKKEYQVLELLCLRKGTVLTKEMFLHHIYGDVDQPVLKIIDVFICNMRKKLAYISNGKDFIETVRGRGYTLRRPSDE
jgi:two-component system, cell cycle response regulator CtrA